MKTKLRVLTAMPLFSFIRTGAASANNQSNDENGTKALNHFWGNKPRAFSTRKVSTNRWKFGLFALAVLFIFLLCGCVRKETVTFDGIVNLVSGDAIDEVLTAEYTDAQYCRDPDYFAGASVGYPFQIPLYDIASGKLREPESGFWYCPIIRDGQVLAMLTVKYDGDDVSVSLDAFLASALSQTLTNTDSTELAVFWCNYSLFALDSHGRIHLLNAFPGKEIPVFPDNLQTLIAPLIDFTAVLTPVSEHLNLTR